MHAITWMLVASLWMTTNTTEKRVEPAPDVVVLENGRQVKGRVVYEDATKLVVLVKSRAREVPLADVASVRARLRELPKALEEVEALAPDDVAGHRALAASLEERNLPRLARIVYWRLLAVAPEDPVAHAALGHEKRGGRWLVPCGRKAYPMEERKALLESFEGAWELDGPHWRVRSNLDLRRAVATVLFLERAYLGFDTILGREIGAWEVLEPMDAWVYAGDAPLDGWAGQARASYSAPDAILYVNVVDEPPVHMLVHETAQALLDFIANRRGAKRGRLPGWLGTDFTQYAEALPAWMNEGIAVHLSSSYEEVDGRIVFREGLYDRRRFAEHAGAVHPMSLTEVLELDTRDFFDPEGISLKYSQTYTLVHFLLFGEDGRYRPRFVRCIRDAYLGQASPSHVLDVLGTPAADLERAWTEHVARLAE